jgi:Fe-S-cluster containining protein
VITKPILDDLPEVYRNFFPDLFGESIPAETMATCHDCAMCSKPGEPRLPNIQYFQPNAKCCTFFPRLPNYLVGGLLADSGAEMEEGRRRVRERIESRISATPHGVAPPKKTSVLLRIGGDPSFGKNKSLLCPYYEKEKGNCTVWKFREAVCSTYFCKSVSGQDGKKFWNTLKMYLLHVQDCLLWYCMHRLNVDTEKMWDYLNAYNTESLTPEELDEIAMPEDLYRGLWGDWTGREQEFYLESFRLVRELSNSEFEEVGGITQQIMVDLLRKRHRQVVTPEIPAVLVQNPEMKMHSLNENECVVMTVSGFFRIQKALYEVIQLFDGVKTTGEISRIVEERYDDTLREDLIIPMFQNRMLISA